MGSNGAVNRELEASARLYWIFMTATLDQLVAEARQRVEKCKRSSDIGGLRARAMQRQPREFRRSVLQTRPAVIAELKKASPSKGLIRADFEPVELARELQDAGAAALSVLTEETHFQGSLEYLRAASAVVSIPILRKDFIVDEFQIVEARASGADAILLIVAALDDEDLVRLKQSADELQLDVLCEVHDSVELKRAVRLGFDIIGVNSRDLRTFKVDLNNALELAAQVPKSAVAVAESGIHTRDDVRRILEAGFQAMLVGESLMRQPRPGIALESLLNVPKNENREVGTGN
jgi:indole-3-glycerol phosphate synthase